MHPLDEWIINQTSTRKKIADNLGISEASLSRYLSGDRIPIQLLQKLYRHSSVTTTMMYQSNFMQDDVDNALDNVVSF